ncbi:hypothetical protein CPB85DRAFT_1344254, partial [Mucidula mucida]
MLDALLAVLVGWHFLPHIALILPCICFYVVSRSAFASTFCTTGILQHKLCDTSLSSISASHVFFTDAFDLDRVGKIQFYTIARYDIPDRRRTEI